MPDTSLTTIAAVGDYILAAECAVQLLWEVLHDAPAPLYCLNVNIPSCPRDELQGWRVTSQDRSRWIGKYTRREATEDERSAHPHRVHLALGGYLKVRFSSIAARCHRLRRWLGGLIEVLC